MNCAVIIEPAFHCKWGVVPNRKEAVRCPPRSRDKTDRQGVASDKSAKEKLASSVENEIAFLSGIVGCTERAVCGRAVQLPIEISSQHSRHKWFQ
ncbi:hypothetical protein SUGI_0167900 [Cryptomeria japonica]|nr:hypothetical protein SUGI_0167900 [Cryptomeria japonica]